MDEYLSKIDVTLKEFTSTRYKKLIDAPGKHTIIDKNGVVKSQIIYRTDMIGYSLEFNVGSIGLILSEDTDLYDPAKDLDITSQIRDDTLAIIGALSKDEIYVYKEMSTSRILKRCIEKLLVAVLCRDGLYMLFDKSSVNNFTLSKGEISKTALVELVRDRALEPVLAKN
jgi:hypothetical protein